MLAHEKFQIQWPYRYKFDFYSHVLHLRNQEEVWPAEFFFRPLYSSLNPGFLAELKGKRKKPEIFLVRDGRATLREFFTSGVRRSSFVTRLIIRDDFLNEVPVEWRAQVASFSWTTTRSHSQAKERLIYGYFNETAAQPAFFEEVLHGADVQGPSGETRTQLFVIPDPAISGTLMASLAQFFSTTGLNLEILDFTKLLERSDWRGVRLVPLFDSNVIGVDWLTQYTLARGAQLADAKPDGEDLGGPDVEMVRLSPYHSCRICWKPFK